MSILNTQLRFSFHDITDTSIALDYQAANFFRDTLPSYIESGGVEVKLLQSNNTKAGPENIEAILLIASASILSTKVLINFILDTLCKVSEIRLNWAKTATEKSQKLTLDGQRESLGSSNERFRSTSCNDEAIVVLQYKQLKLVLPREQEKLKGFIKQYVVDGAKEELHVTLFYEGRLE